MTGRPRATGRDPYNLDLPRADPRKRRAGRIGTNSYTNGELERPVPAVSCFGARAEDGGLLVNYFV